MTRHRPLLTPWHRIARNGELLLFEHAGECVTLEGRAAATFLPRLMALLDGTRTVEELAEALGLGGAQPVARALELLDANGLLTEGPPLAADEQPTVAATVRFLAAGTHAASPARERDRLQATRIAVRGAGAHAAAIARLLLVSGVGDVVVDAVSEPPDTDATLAVVAPSPAEEPRLDAWNSAALAAGAEWMQVLPWDGAAAVVGPVFVPGETACRECYRRRRRSHLEYGDEVELLEAVPLRAPSPPALVSLVTGAAALLALRRCAGDSLLAGAAAVLELGESLRLRVHPVPRVPRCPACSPSARTALPLPWAEAS